MFPGVSSHFPVLQKLDIDLVGRTVGRGVHSNPFVGEIMLIDSSICTAPPARLRAMTLSGLTLFPRFSVWSDPTAATLRSLTALELRFGVQSDPETIRQIRSWDKSSYGRSLIGPRPTPARSLGQWRLTHLVLSATKEVPAYHAFQRLHEASFPNLVSLRIKTMVFRYPDPPSPPTAPGALEDFIMRHATLRTLALDDCAVQADWNRSSHRSWAALCGRMAQGLPHLVDLSLHIAPDLDWTLRAAFTSGYCHGAPGDRFERNSVHDLEVAWRDIEAVQSLERAVRDRAEALLAEASGRRAGKLT